MDGHSLQAGRILAAASGECPDRSERREHAARGRARVLAGRPPLGVSRLRERRHIRGQARAQRRRPVRSRCGSGAAGRAQGAVAPIGTAPFPAGHRRAVQHPSSDRARASCRQVAAAGYFDPRHGLRSRVFRSSAPDALAQTLDRTNARSNSAQRGAVVVSIQNNRHSARL